MQSTARVSARADLRPSRRRRGVRCLRLRGALGLRLRGGLPAILELSTRFLLRLRRLALLPTLHHLDERGDAVGNINEVAKAAIGWTDDASAEADGDEDQERRKSYTCLLYTSPRPRD